MKAVIDTNILIDYLHAVPQAQRELALYQNPAISVISWIEIMAGATTKTESTVKTFLRSFDLLEIDPRVAERAAVLRRSKRIKLPDAVIWATAQVHQCLLVSRNIRDFDPSDPGVRLPYTI